ncbi:MAG: NUDIX domain-containing protein, partial [Anaerolineae bacterium]
DEAGRILLVRRAWEPMQGQWSLPGGYVDHDESPQRAAIREVWEETGLVIEDVELLTLVSGQEENGSKHHHGADLIIVYHARIVGGTLRPADDAAEVKAFTLDQLPPLAFRSTREAVAQLRDLREEETR